MSDSQLLFEVSEGTELLNSILDMLKNVKYACSMANHIRESMVILAKSQHRVPKEDWIIRENAHEAIATAYGGILMSI